MDRRVTLVREVTLKNNFNEPERQSWEMVATFWAKVKHSKGREVVIADRITAVRDVMFYIDYREDLKQWDRIILEAVPYEIISIAPFEESRNRYLEITTQLVDNEEWT